MKYVNKRILSAVDTADQNGATVDANQLISGSFQFLFGDTAATGTVKIQMSNDPDAFKSNPPAVSSTSWQDIPNATGTVTAGVAAPIVISQMCFRWIRAVYVKGGSGNTTVTCDMNCLSV